MTDSQGNRVPRDPAEFLQQLRDQRELLRNAAERYDRGSEAEAMSLATRIRVLVHDTGSGTSLLTHLGVRDRLPYLDTAPAEMAAPVIGHHAGLCMISTTLGVEGSSRYRAPLDQLSPERRHPPSAFIDWWQEVPVLTDSTGHGFSRKDFVLHLANQDGGSHVDALIGEPYSNLTRQNTLNLQPGPSDDPRFRNVAPPSVRQIGYELERTLDEHLSEDPATHGVRIKFPLCPLPIASSLGAEPDDPCPCDSGLTRAECFDQRQPRRVITLEDLMAEMR